MSKQFDTSCIFGVDKFGGNDSENLDNIVESILNDGDYEDDDVVKESITDEFENQVKQLERKLGTKINDEMDDDDRADEMLKNDDCDEDDDDSNMFEPENNNVMFKDMTLKRMSDEQKKQRILQNALSSINIEPMNGGEKVSLDAEITRDRKNMLLEEINMLRTSLSDEGTNISDVSEVDSDNTFMEIENVYKQLRYRNDHKRYFLFATELAQMGASALEWVFDGKKNYLGFSPDLTGWGATLNIKMRRLNYEMSSVVSTGMRNHHINEVSRIALELIPSMFLHSKMRKGRYLSKNKKSSLRDAIGKCRNFEDND